MAGDQHTNRGISFALRKSLGGPLLPDQAADEAFASMIDRLRKEPGTNKGVGK